MIPIVSVIIPVYNGAKFLSRSIDSVLNQTFKNWELIIVDDGSTDNSKEVISDYIKKDSRIQYHWEPNSGTPAKPKNTGFKYVRGKYVAYLDQDDEWLPEKLEKQLAVFAKYPNEEVGLVSCSAYTISEKGFSDAKLPVLKSEVELIDVLNYNYIFSNSSVMIPSTVIKTIGDRDESKDIDYLEDWDMWVRIRAGGYTFKFIEEPLFNYMIHANNVSRATTRLKQIGMVLAFYKKHEQLYKESNTEHLFLKTIGLTCALAGDGKKAREFYKKAIRIKRNYIIPYFGIVLTYFGAGLTRAVIRISDDIAK
jgi:glycosyltransferase involved in cell wall biosynthesis